MAAIDPELPMELLVADSSESHVARVGVSDTAGAPGCAVASPWGCPAVRGGQTLVQPSGRDLDACPRLRERENGSLAGVCVPLSFMGRSLGVLHAATPGDLPDQRVREWIAILGERAASRLGGVRAFARAEVQATTDTLTGLFNRRAFDDHVRRLQLSGQGYGLLLADLDHFKHLNDVHGHGMGDRALQLFSRVLRESVRPDDVIGRYGGEEFVVALPDTNLEGALRAANTIRTALERASAGTEIPAFSVSIGVAHSDHARALPEQLAIADAALLAAKRSGRNTCLTGSPGQELLPTPRSEPDP
jgi:diguanylate cyclase (GGDEF)-like protein